MSTHDCVGRYVLDDNGTRGDHRAISDRLRRVEDLGAIGLGNTVWGAGTEASLGMRPVFGTEVPDVRLR